MDGDYNDLQIEILGFLDEEAGWGVREIGEKFCPKMPRDKASATTNQNCLILERKGLIRRIDDLNPIAWCRTKLGTLALKEVAYGG